MARGESPATPRMGFFNRRCSTVGCYHQDSGVQLKAGQECAVIGSALKSCFGVLHVREVVEHTDKV